MYIKGWLQTHFYSSKKLKQSKISNRAQEISYEYTYIIKIFNFIVRNIKIELYKLKKPII